MKEKTINDLTIFAVVPARAGSKGIPKKNLQKVNGRSLIQRVGELCCSLSWITEAIISSDCPEIIAEGEKFGLKSLFSRPKELSTDTANSLDVWRHAVNRAELYFEKKCDLSILLEPTSPNRIEADLIRTVTILLENNAECAVTVSKTPAHFTPHKTLEIDSSNNLGHFHPAGGDYALRQNIPDYFHRNGICYAATRSHLFGDGPIIRGKTIPVLIERMVTNIDEPFELEIATLIDQGRLSFRI